MTRCVYLLQAVRSKKCIAENRHIHRFQPIANGVEMTDLIYYKLPLGVLGRAINALKVRRDIEEIFSYRKAKIEALFGNYHDLF